VVGEEEGVELMKMGVQQEEVEVQEGVGLEAVQ